jgi:hypothetical protein
VVTQGFPASLNLDPTVVAEAPSIDFGGAGRTVPWVAWHEPNTNLGNKKQIFASRFSAASNVWLPSGQERAPGHSLPSLNINISDWAGAPIRKNPAACLLGLRREAAAQSCQKDSTMPLNEAGRSR